MRLHEDGTEMHELASPAQQDIIMVIMLGLCVVGFVLWCLGRQ